MNSAAKSITEKPELIEGSIVSKAYEIDLNRFDEGYLSDSIICYANSRNEAKVNLLNQIKYDNWVLYNNVEITYLNIPVIRKKSSDKVIFDGKEVLRCSIDDIIYERERIAKLNEITNNPNIQYCYIIKGSYYRPNSCGYTSLRFEAGIYPKDEAVRHAISVREIRLECVDIEEHNKMINQKIIELQDRIIQPLEVAPTEININEDNVIITAMDEGNNFPDKIQYRHNLK